MLAARVQASGTIHSRMQSRHSRRRKLQKPGQWAQRENQGIRVEELPPGTLLQLW